MKARKTCYRTKIYAYLRDTCTQYVNCCRV